MLFLLKSLCSLRWCSSCSSNKSFLLYDLTGLFVCVIPKVQYKLQSNIQRDKLATQKMLQAKIEHDVKEADSSGRRNKAGGGGNVKFVPRLPSEL